MQKLVMLATSALIFTAGSALAQGKSESTEAQGKPATQQATQQMGAMSQQKLRTSLQNAGFSDIRIVDAAYVVHAKTSDGNFVVMYIDPPITMRGQAATTGTGASDQPSNPKQK